MLRMATTRGTRWSLLLPLAVAGVFLVAAFRGVAWQEMWAAIRQARRGLLALAFLLLSVSCFTRAVRWRVLLGAERPVAPLTVFWATMVGYLGNNFLPARAGEALRTVMISRRTGLSMGYVVATALTERVVDMVALILFSMFALLTLGALPAWLLAAWRGLVVVGAVGLVGLFVAPRLEHPLVGLLAWLPLPARLREGLVALVRQFLLGTRAFQHLGRALAFGGLTAAIWLLDAATALLVARAFWLTLSLPQALLLLAALGLASAAPSTPGYLGIYQFVAVTVLGPFGFTRDQALAYIIGYQAVIYAVVTVWGLLGLQQSSLSRAAVRRPAALEVAAPGRGSELGCRTLRHPAARGAILDDTSTP